MKQAGKAPKKSLGQHWLRDEAALEAMCAAADVQPEDTVLEIGPGLGTLTELLVQRARRVVAVEFDEKLARELPNYLPGYPELRFYWFAISL
jgi:16S rRNA (adenine1518-N6/adenine1519-N6)-dimethyltransferase